MTSRQDNVKWVDGLRGIASILVVFTHLARAFDDGLFRTTQEEGQAPRYLQLPIIRVFLQGRIGVAIFSLVTGYVCALRPVRQFREGNQQAAFRGIAKSAFRRVPRLVLPTTLVTCLIWVLCEFQLFENAKRSNSWWLNVMSPTPRPLLRVSLKTLLHALITTWTTGTNPYDPNQWNLAPLLKGAMLVYTMLVATSFCKARYRMMISLALYIYYFVSNDAAIGMQFFFGVFLADLSQTPSHLNFLKSYPQPFRLISPLLIASGLFMASYPESEAQRLPWSRFLTNYGGFIFPFGADTPRYFTAFGLQCITLGIHTSPSAKNLLSNSFFLWLGKHSYAVYLLHGTLIRTIATWMFFGWTMPKIIVREDGSLDYGPQLQVCGRWRWYGWMPFWWIGLYSCAIAWTKWVDPVCARITESMVRCAFEEEESVRGERSNTVTSSSSREREAEKPLLPR